MKILLLTDSYPPEIRSASQLMYELAQEFVRRNHQVTVITAAAGYNLAPGEQKPPTRPVTVSKEEGVKVVRVMTGPCHNVGPILRGIGQLTLPFSLTLGGLLAGPADVVYVYSPPLTMAVGAVVLGWLKRAPCVVNVQDLFPQNAIDLGVLKGRLPIALFRAMEYWVYKHATAITVHSEGNRKEIGRQVPDPRRISVVHNWVDLDAYRPGQAAMTFRARHGLEGTFLLMFAGVMGYAQDLETVIEAASRLRARKDIVFLLIGDGVGKPALVRKVEELGLSNVRFFPWVRPEDYPNVLAEVDVGLVTLKKTMKTPVVPSKLLGFMAAGKPVLAGLNPESDAVSIVTQSGCGLAVPPGDADAMAEAVRTLSASAAGGRAMGARGRAYAEAHFSKSKTVDQLEQLLNRCLIQRKERMTHGRLSWSLSGPNDPGHRGSGGDWK